MKGMSEGLGMERKYGTYLRSAIDFLF